ncbi:DNA-directed RNA polymerase I subunit RPA43 [Rhinatrema bivittatum]|uniref:DNA-directed RNA polymerase I subunit RPA43 n=1 Tax=Rhinatrema bivittatum TaxID=194408 RepID=UPI00112D97B8|nr:DNA-directed RNA polymerase I subunit RPA43 [Rhinatrema bivittatum]
MANGTKSAEALGESGRVESLPQCLEVPSFAAASALLSRRGSCLVLQTHRRHLALPPRHLRTKRTGVRQELDSELLRYSDGLKGVPVAYDNIKIVGELGDIYDDQGYIHLSIEADFVIFCPKKGHRLVGVVNKVALSHIGCLVHGCFNASIPKPYQMSVEEWQGLEVKVGDQLEFEVFRLDSDAVGVFCIWGKLISDRIDVAAEESVNGLPVEKPKKKKKRKLENARVQGSDSSGYQSDHTSHKKRKRKHLDEEAKLVETDQEPKAKKAQKKLKDNSLL